MPRRFVACITALVAGCATAGPPPETERVLVYDSNGDAIRTTVDDATRPTVIDAPLDRVVRATVAAYERIGIPAGMMPGSGKRIGNLQFAMPRRFLEQPPSRFLECGTSMTGAIADQSRLQVSVVTEVREVEGGKASVSTAVRGVARPMSGASSDPLACASTGRIELRLVRDIRDAITIMGTTNEARSEDRGRLQE